MSDETKKLIDEFLANGGEIRKIERGRKSENVAMLHQKRGRVGAKAKEVK